LRRKVAMVWWLARYLPRLWSEIGRADAVHAPVPGDVGMIGIFLALARRKRLFVRHCGTWGEPVTAADRLLLWLLERIAGGRNVVMATGGGDRPPSQKNPAITWIHSTTLTEAELAAIKPAQTWRRGEPLRLVTVGRLDPLKNTAAAVRSLPLIGRGYEPVTLDVVGGGPCLDSLKQLAEALAVGDRVVFHGNVPHWRVLEILQQGHIFLFPTQTKEGFPKALLEAMACGLPAVATAVSVIPHLLADECGLLLQDPTAEALADAVFRLIDDEAKLGQIAARAARRSRQYTLESWGGIIGQRLEAAWGRPLTIRPELERVAFDLAETAR
jgi:glycosyltransferase involved in cell wall biosynthesis